jgi:hypothetical protein
MDDVIFLITGIIGLISGILIILRPKWFRNLWKIRTAYEYWGEKTASYYYYVLGVLTAAIGLWLIIKYLLQLFM